MRKGGKIILIEVSEEFYTAMMPEIWRRQKAAQRAGLCRCPRSKLPLCDALCNDCEFYKTSGVLSLDEPVAVGESETSLGAILPSGDMSPEEIVERKDQEALLAREIALTDEESRAIIRGICEEFTEREIAAALGLTQSSVHSKKKKALDMLRKMLEKE